MIVIRRTLPLCRLLLAATILPGSGLAAQDVLPLRIDSIEVGGRIRTYLLYAPPVAPPAPALLLVLHGAVANGATIRALTQGAAERLADHHGFLVAYPDGFQGTWNGCRRGSPYPANREGIDDVGFLGALVDRLVADHGVDPSRVWAFGFSNGGHMALRLALEVPEKFPAVVAVAASLPAASELDCAPSGRPASVLFVNGTADPINPYEGGEVQTESAGRIGEVRSSLESARYFAGLIGAPEGTPAAEVVSRDKTGEPRIECARWTGKAGREAVLVTVHDGDHSIPGYRPAARAAEKAVPGYDALEEAIHFLRRVSGTKPP